MKLYRSILRCPCYDHVMLLLLWSVAGDGWVKQPHLSITPNLGWLRLHPLKTKRVHWAIITPINQLSPHAPKHNSDMSGGNTCSAPYPLEKK